MITALIFGWVALIVVAYNTSAKVLEKAGHL